MKYKVGDIIEVRVTKCYKTGAFCEIGREKCFIHISQFADYQVSNVNDFVQIGDIVTTEVVGYQPHRHCYLLSYKSIRNVPRPESEPTS